MPVEKTVDELFEEYAEIRSDYIPYKTLNKWDKEREQQIIQEVKSQVRKERDNEILNFIDSGHPAPATDSGWSISLDDVEEFIKGITLKN